MWGIFGGENQMNCPYENCNKSFDTARGLANHVRWHEPAEWHKDCREKISISNADNKNGMWKGDEVSYGSLHDWVHYNLKKPNLCSSCGARYKLLDAANISGEYKRDLNDWEYICRRCHMLKDGRMKNLKQFQGDE